MRPLITVLLFVFACAALPARADFATGMRAYEAEDYATAFREWRPLAEAGDARAQYRVARLFRYGRGVAQDFKAAVVWYKKAATQTVDGETMRRAVYALGYMTKYGHGANVDMEKAECLYRNSAENGYANAQFALYKLLREKPGIDFEAMDWAERGAAQGEPWLLYAVGYVMVLNPNSDDSEGFMRMILAARKGIEQANNKLEIYREFTETKIVEALRKGEEMADGWRAVPEAPPAHPVPVPGRCLP